MSTPLKIQIIVDDDGSVKVRKFGQEAEKAGRKGETSFKKTGKSLDDMNRKTASATSHVLKLAAAAVSIGALYIAFKKVIGALEEYTSLAGVQTSAETRLASVLNATGYAAGYNIDQLKAMAGAMQLATTTGDEVTLKGMAILATFKQIRGEGFERATMAALDMAEVMEGDLKGSIVMIGKALNDPIANLSAMTRAGVQFTAGQKDMIKQLWETGETMAAQAIILSELESQFGGAAKAARDIFPGALKATQNALGDVKEEIGFIIVKNQYFVESLDIVEEWLIDLGAEIRANREDFQDLAKDGVLNLVDAITLGVTAVGMMITSLKSLSGYSLLLEEVWLKMKEINILIADPLGNDKIWQQMLLEVKQAQVDVANAQVKLAESLEGSDAATVAVVKRLQELRDKLAGVGVNGVEVAGTLDTVVVQGIKDAGDAAKQSKKDLEAFAQAMNTINNISTDDWFDWEGLDRFKRDLKWLNSEQFAASVAIEWEDPEVNIKGLSSSLNDLFEQASGSFDGQSFGDSLAQGINNAVISMQELLSMYEKQAKIIPEIAKARQEAEAISDLDKRAKALAQINDIETAMITSQLSGYRQLFGTTSQLFDENSKEREAMHNMEMAMAVAEIAMSMQKQIAIIATYFTQEAAAKGAAVTNAITGITAQASVPVGGFALVAAMTALMAGVLSIGGIAFGGGGGASVSATPALPSSTVLGAAAGTGSESIANAYEMLEEFHAEEYAALRDIYGELQDLNQNITGLVTAIVKGGLEFFNQSATTVETTRWESIGSASSMAFLDPVIGKIYEYIGGMLFGGDVTTTPLYGGISVADVSISDVLADMELDVRQYQNWLKETEGGLFGGGGSEYWTEVQAASDEVTKLFTMIFSNIAETFVNLSEGLLDGSNMQAVLDYVMDIGQINLNDLDAEGINEAVNTALSNMTDEMAQALFGEAFGQYQQLGEGMMETLVRLVMEKEVILSVLEKTGYAFQGTAEEAVAFTQSLIEIAGGFDELVSAFETYYEAFYTDAEKQADLYEYLTTVFSDMNQILPATREEYRALVEYLAQAGEEYAEQYVTMLSLAGAADEYYDSLEDTRDAINQIAIDAFNDELNALASNMERISSIFQQVNADIEKYNWQSANPGAVDSEYLLSQLTTIQTRGETEGYTGADLELAAQLMSDWYYTKAAEIDAAAQARHSWTEVIDKTVELLGSIESTIDSIKNSALNVSLPKEKLDEAAQDYTQKFADAMTGDATKAQDYLDFTSTYLGTAQAALKSSPEYQAEYARVMADLATLQGMGFTETVEHTPTVDNPDADYRDQAYYDAMDALNSRFELAAEYIHDAMLDVQNDFLLTIDWANYSGSMADALAALDSIVSQYGWDNTITLSWISDMAAWASADIDTAIGIMEYIAEQSGGWGTPATLTFIADLASNVGTIEDAGTILAEIYAQTEDWNATASLTFLANLDLSGWTYDDMMTAIGALVTATGSWDSPAVLEFIANVSSNIGTIEEAAYALETILTKTGSWESPATLTFLTNLDLSGWTYDEIQAALDYIVETSGGWDSPATKAFVASLTTTGDLTPEELKALTTPADVTSSNTVEARYSATSDLTQEEMFQAINAAITGGTIIANIESSVIGAVSVDVGSVHHDYDKMDLEFNLQLDMIISKLTELNTRDWTYYPLFRNNLKSIAVSCGGTGYEYGGMSYGPESGYVANLHGNELIVSPKASYPATVISNGGSTRVGQSDRSEELSLLRELVELQKEEIDTLRAKDTAPVVHVAVDAEGIMRNAGAYVSERTRRGTLDVRGT